MNVSQMKNILVLKDLPSNIVDEAIIILKNHKIVKKKEIVESTGTTKKFEDNFNGSNELAVKEAESLIQDYLKKLEKSKMEKKHTNTILNKYRKLQVVSILLTIISVIGIMLCAIK